MVKLWMILAGLTVASATNNTTTVAPGSSGSSNTTTVAPGNTTTVAPGNTTTVAPATTAAPGNETTPAPTTTGAPATTGNMKSNMPMNKASIIVGNGTTRMLEEERRLSAARCSGAFTYLWVKNAAGKAAMETSLASVSSDIAAAEIPDGTEVTATSESVTNGVLTCNGLVILGVVFKPAVGAAALTKDRLKSALSSSSAVQALARAGNDAAKAALTDVANTGGQALIDLNAAAQTSLTANAITANVVTMGDAQWIADNVAGPTANQIETLVESSAVVVTTAPSGSDGSATTTKKSSGAYTAAAAFTMFVAGVATLF